MERKKGDQVSLPGEVIKSDFLHFAIDTLTALPDDLEITTEAYLHLAKKALRKREITLAMVFLASRELMRRSKGLSGERRFDGSGILDVALPPLDAIDAIAYLDELRERWVDWYGYGDYLAKRRRAAIRIVVSHYGRKVVSTMGRALRLKYRGD